MNQCLTRLKELASLVPRDSIITPTPPHLRDAWMSSFIRHCPEAAVIASYHLDLWVCSKKWEELLGWSVREIQKRQFGLLHPEDLEKTHAAIDRLHAGESLSGFTNRYRHKEGHWIPLEWSSHMQDRIVYAIARKARE